MNSEKVVQTDVCVYMSMLSWRLKRSFKRMSVSICLCCHEEWKGRSNGCLCLYAYVVMKSEKVVQTDVCVYMSICLCLTQNIWYRVILGHRCTLGWRFTIHDLLILVALLFCLSAAWKAFELTTLERAAKGIEMACHILTLSQESEVMLGITWLGVGGSSVFTDTEGYERKGAYFHDFVSSAFLPPCGFVNVSNNCFVRRHVLISSVVICLDLLLEYAGAASIVCF